MGLRFYVRFLAGLAVAGGTICAIAQVQTERSAAGASVPEAFSKLPDEYRSDPVLMYKSQSLQEASPEYPRVILFGKGQGQMLRFNGLMMVFPGQFNGLLDIPAAFHPVR